MFFANKKQGPEMALKNLSWAHEYLREISTRLRLHPRRLILSDKAYPKADPYLRP